MKKLNILLLAVVLLSFTVNYQRKQNVRYSSENPKLGLKQIIEACALTFKDKIDSSYTEKVVIALENASEAYTLTIGPNKKVIISNGSDSMASIFYKADAITYNRFYYGEMAPGTAVAQASSSDPIPLNYSFGKHVTFDSNFLNRFLFFTQRFFNRDIHDKLILNQERSRIVHGAYAIPIFYQRQNDIGVRSAWYQLNKGQRANEEGDPNPFPQYVIVITGSLNAVLANDTLVMHKGEAYLIAPNTKHSFWNNNNEPCELIWIAWGKGA